MSEQRVSDEELERLESLAKAATLGPWEECGRSRGGCKCGQVWSIPADSPVAISNTDSPDEGIESTTERKKADAAYIAVANPETMLRLLADLARLSAELERMRAKVLDEVLDEVENWHEAQKDFSADGAWALALLHKALRRKRDALTDTAEEG
jgi:hypothetical protein